MITRTMSRGCWTISAALAAGALVASGCGSDDGDETVQLADTGKLTLLADMGFQVPTTVAVRGQDAWVPHGQLGGSVGTPPLPPATMPFKVDSAPLAGGGIGTAVISLPGTDQLFP